MDRKIIDFRTRVSLDGVSLEDIEFGREIQKVVMSGDVNAINDLAIGDKLKDRFEKEDLRLGNVMYPYVMTAVEEEDFEELSRLLLDVVDYLYA